MSVFWLLVQTGSQIIWINAISLNLDEFVQIINEYGYHD